MAYILFSFVIILIFGVSLQGINYPLPQKPTLKNYYIEVTIFICLGTNLSSILMTIKYTSK